MSFLHMPHPVAHLTVGILIVSTTAAEAPSSDLTYERLEHAFLNANGTHHSCQWDVKPRKIVTDDAEAIKDSIKEWTDAEDKAERLNLIVTSGGTGFGHTDYTPEAVTSLLHRHAPGLVHAMLTTALAITPFAAMSRLVAGSRNSTIIITLPGSPKGAVENLGAVLNLLPHACIQAAGLQDSRELHAGGVKKLEADAGVSGTSSGRSDPGRHGSHRHNNSGQTEHHSCPHGHHHHHSPKSHVEDTKRAMKPGESVTRRHRSSPYPMISVAEAHDHISQNTPTRDIVEMSVGHALRGYILAQDIKAPVPVPAFRASIVDGYAVVGSDGPGIYPVTTISHAAAGEELSTLKPGQVARVTTGAPVPPGATAVVMVEDTVLVSTTEDGKEEKEVKILASKMATDENIRQIGSDVEVGSVILRKGTEVTAVGGEIGILASVGITKLKVFRKPTVGILSTGDEVVDHDRPGELRIGEIRDSNRPTLIAAVMAAGFMAVDLGVAKDKGESLETTLKSALGTVDIVITTGGVSMGELDLLKPTIEHTLSGTIHFGRVAMKPGKPTTFASVPAAAGTNVKKLIFALPGNPASALVTFHLFVLPSLRQFSGIPIPQNHLPRVVVTLAHDLRLDPRPEYVRAVASFDAKDGRLVAESTGGQRSSRVGSMARANALLCIPALADPGLEEETRECGIIRRGGRVEAILIAQIVGL